MTARGSTVRCWARSYRFRGPLPSQILSQGQSLLAGPVRFRSEGEAPLKWDRSAFSRHPGMVGWSSTAARNTGNVHARTTIEYDGFCTVDVNLGRGSFHGLSLDVPLVSRIARYLHFVDESHYKERNTLSLSEGKGGFWASPFACMVWVGDEKVGFAWCADSDAPFRLQHPERALTLRRTGSSVILRITLIDHPVTLKSPVRWRFGLMATPVRPMPAGWRSWRLGPGASANMRILWWNEWTSSHADTVPSDPRDLARRARIARSDGGYLLPYAALLALSERSAVYKSQGRNWRREPFSRMDDEGTPYWIMCPNTGWKSYFPAQMARLCRETGINGLYLDFTFPYRCEAAGHPCGYVDEHGVRHGDFRIFALRELAKSTYEQVKAVNPRARILMHTSGALMYPYIGFADMMLNGEQLRQPLARASGHYMDVLPLDVLRAEYGSRQAGLAPFVIPELATPQGLPDPALTSFPGPTEEMLALLLLHDIGVWPIYCHLATVEAVRRAQRAFGTAQAQFYPYWENGGPLETGGSGLLASAWVKSTGALIVIVNPGHNTARIRVRMRPKIVDGRVASVVDALTGRTIPRVGPDPLIDVPPRRFRLIAAKYHGWARRR